MKYNKKIPAIPKTTTGLLLLLCGGLLWIGCSDNMSDTSLQKAQNPSISPYDGQPIIELNGLSYFEGSYFESWRNRLAGSYGPELVKAVNSQTTKAKDDQEVFAGPVMLNEVISGSKAKSGTSMSTHLRLSEPDGEVEEFMLSVRRYVHDEEASRAKATQLAAEDTWLALNPDRFYLQDDDEGNELWPVTFPAVNMADSSRTIEVTFDRHGYVSSSAGSATQTRTQAKSGEPSLVFVEPISVMSEDDCDSSTQFKDCGDSGGGGTGGGGDDGPSCIQTNGSGSSVNGPTEGIQTYFAVKKIRLFLTGDGDGASELQMYTSQNDDYNHCFPKSYKYHFDTVYSYDPMDGGTGPNETNIGADNLLYSLPDVNHAGITYNVEDSGFPLFDLNRQPGPWRLVFSDDDKDYGEFSRRRQSEYSDDIWTYDMSVGSWTVVNTGFSVDRKTYGSSDDPIRESAVRRITETNMDRLVDIYDDHTTTKQYSGGSFSYTFSLLDY